MNRTDATPHSKKRSAPRIIYYHDEKNDDFSGIRKQTIPVDESFPYLHKNPFWNVAAFFVYRLVMTPFAFLYCKWRFRLRIINRKVLRRAKRQGIFLYSNHTLMAGDAFIPNLVTFPRRTHVVVNADNLSTPGTKHFVQMCGAIPLPTRFSGMRGFLTAVEKRNLQGHCIQIYPEAHIWPYYTGIRPFGSEAFRYPVRYGGPVFCTTTTFQQRKHGSTPRITVYVDGPFAADPSLHPREQEQRLRDAVYHTMCERAKNSTYAPIHYVQCDNHTPAAEGEMGGC